MRRSLPVFHLACLLAILSGIAASHRAQAESVGTYHVRMREDSMRLMVSATLPLAGSALRMETTRPVGVPELDSLSWSGLVPELRVSDAAGNSITATRDGTRGWKLSRSDTTATIVTVEYVVDYAPLARLGWPAPHEAAYRDSDNFVLVGRSLFVTTQATRECRVAFELPKGWHASTPWPARGGNETYVADTPQDLVENLVVFSRRPRDDVAAMGFRLHINALGQWAEARADVRRVLEPVIRHHVAMMGVVGRTDYVVVLLPQRDFGGESYRGSFAASMDSLPGPSTTAALGNLVAHEIFHLWNGWMLRGADYASTQWFQEGFTEYSANVAIASSGLVSEQWFRSKLAEHLRNSRELATTLENTGGHKGPPLYSAGALVAFAWDVRIREASAGRRNLGDFFRELLRRTDGGMRKYAWTDIRAALDATATGDWEGDYQAFVRGKQPLPIDPALAAVAQRRIEDAGGVRIEADPGAPAAARQRWAELLRAR